MATNLDRKILIKHGIKKNCRVSMKRMEQVLLDRYQITLPCRNKYFKKSGFYQTHYGRHYLSIIAKFAFYAPYNFNKINLKELYDEYIGTPHSALNLEKFSKIIEEYLVIYECRRDHRRKIIAAELQAHFDANIQRIHAQKKKEKRKKHAKRIPAGSYRFKDIIPDSVKTIEEAFQNAHRCHVVIPRIYLSSEPVIPSEVTMVWNQTDAIAVAKNNECDANGLHNTKQNDCLTEATQKLLNELVKRTSNAVESNSGLNDPLH